MCYNKRDNINVAAIRRPATDTPEAKENITVIGAVTDPLPSRELSDELRVLWTECFQSPDGAEDADKFCRCSDALTGGKLPLPNTGNVQQYAKPLTPMAWLGHQSECSTILWRVDGTAAGMCNLVPVAAGELRGLYLFAVGVRPDFRGMGGFRALCRAAAERASQEKLDFLCLVPATEALDATYRRFGYGGNVKIPRWRISAEYASALTPAPDFPLPCVSDGSTVMPSAGFLKYLRSSYRELCLGGAFLLCGDEGDGGRAVYEYIPCPGDPYLPTPVDCGSHGLVLPITPRAERLLSDGISFYSTMGED